MVTRVSLYTVLYIVLLLAFVTTIVASSDENRDDNDNDNDNDNDDKDRGVEVVNDKNEQEANEAESERDDSDPLVRRLWIIHGSCAATAWAILVPLAISSSLLRKLLERSKIAWFPIHRLLNGTAILLTIIAIGFAVAAYSYDDDDAHFVDEPHHLVGLLIGIGSFLQGLNGFLRPHLPHQHPPAAAAVTPADPDGAATKESQETNGSVRDDDGDDSTNNHHPTTTHTINSKRENSTVHSDDGALPKTTEGKSRMRILWEYLHKSLGITLLAASWWQVQSGLYLFADEFNGPDLRSVFFGVVGAISGTALLLYACQCAVTIKDH